MIFDRENGAQGWWMLFKIPSTSHHVVSSLCSMVITKKNQPRREIDAFPPDTALMYYFVLICYIRKAKQEMTPLSHMTFVSPTWHLCEWIIRLHRLPVPPVDFWWPSNTIILLIVFVSSNPAVARYFYLFAKNKNKRINCWERLAWVSTIWRESTREKRALNLLAKKNARHEP